MREESFDNTICSTQNNPHLGLLEIACNRNHICFDASLPSEGAVPVQKWTSRVVQYVVNAEMPAKTSLPTRKALLLSFTQMSKKILQAVDKVRPYACQSVQE
jgi:hypothetical protein